MYNILIGITLWLIAAFTAPSVFADHNSDLPGHNPDRGYTAENCLKMESKTTGRPAVWLGHELGCLIEEKRIEDGKEVIGYVLVMEYQVEKLTKEQGEFLLVLDAMFPEDLTPVPNKGITM